MPLDDYSAPIDAGFGLGPGQPAKAGGSHQRPISGHSGQYRQALARSLNTGEADKSAQADHETVPSETPEKPAAPDGPTGPAADGRERKPAENQDDVDDAAADRSTSPAPISTDQLPLLQTGVNTDTPAHAANVDQTHTGEAFPPAGLRLFVPEPDVPVITLSDDVPPEPPANIQLLLEETAGEPNGNFTCKPVGFEVGEPLSPPAGLFGITKSAEVAGDDVTPNPVVQVSEPHIISDLPQDIAAGQSPDASNRSDADGESDTVSSKQNPAISTDAPASMDVSGNGVPIQDVAAALQEPNRSTGRGSGRNDVQPVTVAFASPGESARDGAEQVSSAPISDARHQPGQPIGGVQLAGNLSDIPSAGSAVDQGNAISEAVRETVKAAAPVKSTSTPATGFTHYGANTSLPVPSKADAAPAQQAGAGAEVDPAGLADRVASAVRQAQQGRGQLRARLHPPELGTLQIEVSARDGILSVRLEVSRAAAQKMLVENMPLLHDALAQNGTRVARIDVHLNLNGTDDGASEQDHQSEDEPQQRQPGRQQQENSDEQAADDHHRPQPKYTRRHMDQLDIQI